MRYFPILLILILGIKVHAQVPVIRMIEPYAAAAGTAVEIKGNNFDTSASNNIVYFGAVTGNVLSGSDSSLVVIVPFGANTARVTVTAHHLTGISPNEFYLITNSNDLALNAGSFSIPLAFRARSPFGPYVNDMNGDGKPDITLGNASSMYNNIFLTNRTIVSDSIIMDTSAMPVTIMSGSGGTRALADFNNDGKKDLVSFQGAETDSTKKIVVYKNKSAANIIEFGDSQFLGGKDRGGNIRVADFDNDGKIDFSIACSNAAGQECNLLIYRNTTSGDTISFAAPVYISISNVGIFDIADFNQDGLEDVALCPNDNSILLFRNNSTPGNIFFIPVPALDNGTYSINTIVRDMNHDDKPDIISQADKINIFINQSTSSDISFTGKIEIPRKTPGGGIAVAEVTGDTLNDIIQLDFYNGTAPDSVTILKNKSTRSATSFDTGASFLAGNTTVNIAGADINMDGKPDIVFASKSINLASLPYNYCGILCNKMESTANLFELCPPQGSTSFTTTQGNIYQWQVKTDTGFTNLTENNYYAGVTGQILRLNNVPSSFSGNAYRCLVDNIAGKMFQLKFVNNWAGDALAVNTNWSNPANWVCGQVPDENTDVQINYGPVYIDTNAQCRSLTVKPGVVISTAPGITLTITH